MPAAPNTITSDQDMAIINACRKIFPTSFHILDEWHLSINQIKNVSSFLQDKGSSSLYRGMREGSTLLRRVGSVTASEDASTFDQMSADLFSLRRSSTPQRYEQRRSELEMLYSQTTIRGRSWNGTTVFIGIRKRWWQIATISLDVVYDSSSRGVVTPEKFNSLFRNLVMQRGVPMSRVPTEMKRVTERYFRERRDQRVVFQGSSRQLSRGLVC